MVLQVTSAESRNVTGNCKEQELSRPLGKMCGKQKEQWGLGAIIVLLGLIKSKVNGMGYQTH